MPDNTLDDQEIREGDSLVTPLPQDYATPAAPLSDDMDDENEDSINLVRSGRLDPTHPATDSASNIDAHELYDEGLSGAAEAEEPRS